MKKSYAIIGLGRFGLAMVEELSKINADVIAIDISEESVTKAAEYINHAFICDSTNEAALHEIGIQNVDHAIIAFGSNLQATILSTVLLKEMNIPKITVRVDNDYYVPIIKKLGATDIISPQKLAGVRLANKVVSDTFIDYFNLSEDYCIVEALVVDDFKSISIQDLNPRNTFDVNIVLITRGNSTFQPKGNDEILPKDRLFIFGHRHDLAKFNNYLSQHRQ